MNGLTMATISEKPVSAQSGGQHILVVAGDPEITELLSTTLELAGYSGRRLVVVGAGFLGAEAAAVARGLGAEVTLLEPAPVPLARGRGAPRRR